jgi:hypothetical protein
MNTGRDIASVEVPGTVPRPLGLLIHTVIVGFTALMAASVWTNRIERFRELFRGFGADLPPPTQFVLGSAWIWYVLALCGAGLGAWVINKPAVSHAELRKMKFAVRAFTVVAGLFVAFAIYAIYAPIFALRAVV